MEAAASWIGIGSGGALGLAHVGAILWMEEHRISVDHIAGTSMGGLVRGAYATEMSATDLKNMISRIDWDNTVFNSRAKYEDLPLRSKDDQKTFPAMFELGVKHGREYSYRQLNAATGPAWSCNVPRT